MFIRLHENSYAEQERTEGRCLGSSKIQMSMKLTCVREAVLCCIIAFWVPNSLLKTRVTFPKTLMILRFRTLNKCMWSAYLFVFQRLHGCLILFSRVAEGISSSHGGTTGFLPSFCFTCMLLNMEIPRLLVFCKNAPSCVCAGPVFPVILHISDEHSLDVRLTALTFVQESLSEVEEKYKKAMVSNAQLDNEKNNLIYQVDTLKDVIEEQEEQMAEFYRENEEKSKVIVHLVSSLCLGWKIHTCHLKGAALGGRGL